MKTLAMLAGILVIAGVPSSLAEAFGGESSPHQVISRGKLAGTYQAFPDACRLANGDILCVFYGGYGHVSLPNPEWPLGGASAWSGRAMKVGRGASLASCSTGQKTIGTRTLPPCAMERSTALSSPIDRSTGRRSSMPAWLNRATVARRGVRSPSCWRQWAVSAPVREMTDGTRLIGVYTEADATAYGGVVRSTDKGQTWSEPIPIQPKSGVRLDAETDVIQLPDGSVFAALRGDGQVHMHFSRSTDLGRTWSPIQDSGFLGHCPHLNRLSTGEILLLHRLPQTSLHISRDDAATWQGPYLVDDFIGAYPSSVELKDQTVLIVYYEEGGARPFVPSGFA